MVSEVEPSFDWLRPSALRTSTVSSVEPLRLEEMVSEVEPFGFWNLRFGA